MEESNSSVCASRKQIIWAIIELAIIIGYAFVCVLFILTVFDIWIFPIRTINGMPLMDLSVFISTCCFALGIMPIYYIVRFIVFVWRRSIKLSIFSIACLLFQFFMSLIALFEMWVWRGPSNYILYEVLTTTLMSVSVIIPLVWNILTIFFLMRRPALTRKYRDNAKLLKAG